jgi:predicted lipid-binding transport protein (Tim44 family)
MIKEEMNAPAAPFNETWHFRKDNTVQKWLLSGLQQN